MSTSDNPIYLDDHERLFEPWSPEWKRLIVSFATVLSTGGIRADDYQDRRRIAGVVENWRSEIHLDLGVFPFGPDMSCILRDNKPLENA